MKGEMKKTLLALMLVAASFGCKTVDGKRVADVDRIARLAGNAASIGATIYLRQHPEQRAAFLAGDAALTRLIDTENYSPVAFADALKGLPINALKGNNSDLYISTVLVVWDEVAATADSVTQKELVKKTLVAVRDAIRRAASVQ